MTLRESSVSAPEKPASKRSERATRAASPSSDPAIVEAAMQCVAGSQLIGRVQRIHSPNRTLADTFVASTGATKRRRQLGPRKRPSSLSAAASSSRPPKLFEWRITCRLPPFLVSCRPICSQPGELRYNRMRWGSRTETFSVPPFGRGPSLGLTIPRQNDLA